MSPLLDSFKKILLLVVFGINPSQSIVAEDEIDTFAEEQLNEDGAPVEKESPLGYEVTYFGAFYLVLHGVIGTGIFATPGTVVKSMGSIGSSYILWVVGFVVTLFQVFMYVEYVTYFRRRSGGDVAYLEQAFPKPQFMVPVMYAAVTVVLSFATSSASAFAKYVFKAADYSPSDWELRGMSIAPMVLAAGVTAINTKLAIRLNAVIGFVKVVFVLFIALSGFAALAGSTKMPKDHSIFKDTWKDTTTNGNDISNSIMKVVFTYGGTGYAFGVVAETNPRSTIKTYKYFVPLTLFVIFVLYMLVITAYYAGIQDIDVIKDSGNLIVAEYFERIFETKSSVKAACAFVALSSYGHLLTVYISHSRSLRECGRQGVLPYPELWTSVKPWGTPLLPICVTFLVNLIVLLAPPPGDAYNFIVDLGSYSGYIFNLLLISGLFKLRRDRKKRGLGYREFHAPTTLLVIVILWASFVLVMAFVPPEDTLIGSDVSFFYATYPLTTFGLFALCILYYVIWSQVLPRIGKFEYRVAEYALENNGEKGLRVAKIKLEDLEQWDREHERMQGFGTGYDDEMISTVKVVSLESGTSNEANLKKTKYTVETRVV